MGARMRKLISSSKFPYSGKSDRDGYLQGGYDMALGVRGGFLCSRATAVLVATVCARTT